MRNDKQHYHMKFLDFLKYNRESFGAKILYLFTVFILVIYFSFTSFFIYYQSKTLKKHLISEGERLANLLAYSSRLGVFAENKDLLEDPIEGIMQYRDVTLIQVFTSDGKELKTHGRPEEENKRRFLEQKTIEMLRKSKTTFYSESGDKIEFWAPVITGGGYAGEEALFFREDSSHKKDNLIGFVRIIFTTELLKKSLETLLLRSILILVFFMIPGWIIVYLLVRGITKPLYRLTEGVKAIGTGGSVEKVSVETKDEIGKLARAFNNMAETLKKREVEKQQLEEQLRHAQKIEAVGTLAGGIAHDFNNILSIIIGYGQLLQKKINKKDEAKQYLEQMLSSAGKAVALTQGLLAFSRKQTINPRPVNLNDIISDAKKILERLLSENIEFKVELADKDLIVMSDAGQIEQVLMNLVTNARDAMPDGGFLTITTKSVELQKQFFMSSDDGKPGWYAMLSVKDTGIGMDKRIKERIFDPFFTTKEVGKGTGLGLSMVYGIIRQHHGYIDVSSKPHKGTTFKIYLPLSEIGLKEKESLILAVLKGGTETVLIAEDDEDVRRLAADILEQYGYKVIETVDGKDAVEKFIRNKDKVKFLLLDVIMPRKNGREVYEEIRKIRPDIKALFISGYAANLIRKNEDAEGEINFLPKPISPDELIRKVREILDK